MAAYLIVFSQDKEAVAAISELLKGFAEVEQRQKATVYIMEEVPQEETLVRLWDALHLHEVQYHVVDADLAVTQILNREMLRARNDLRFEAGTRIKHDIYGHGQISDLVNIQGDTLPKDVTIVKWTEIKDKKQPTALKIDELTIYNPDIQIGQVTEGLEKAKAIVVAVEPEHNKAALLHFGHNKLVWVDKRDLSVINPTTDDIIDIHESLKKCDELTVAHRTELLEVAYAHNGLLPYQTQRRKTGLVEDHGEIPEAYLSWARVCPSVSMKTWKRLEKELGKEFMMRTMQQLERDLKYNFVVERSKLSKICQTEKNRLKDISELET